MIKDITQLQYTPLSLELEDKIKAHVEKQKALYGHGEGPGISFGKPEFEEVISRYQEFYPSKTIGANETFKLPTSLVDEILAHLNISVDDAYNSVKVQLARTQVIPPHRDYMRKATLYYLISETGPQTNFYDGPSTPDDIIAYKPTSLTNKREFVMKQSTWYSFENCAIHEVVNITSERTSLVIDISNSDLMDA
jgi:hypothetical protein